MSLEDDSRSLIETMDGALRGSFGVDPDRDHDEVCALATTGYVVSCWRNTVLEDIHSGGFVPSAHRGSYARDGIRDRDMARLNVAIWRQIRPHVHPTGIDVMAVRDLLRDKKRPVTIGANTFTCGDLFAGTWTNTIQWLMTPPMSPTRGRNAASGPMTHKALPILKDRRAGAPSQAPAHFEPILPEVATMTPRGKRCSKGSGAVDRSVADRGDGRMGPRCHRTR